MSFHSCSTRLPVWSLLGSASLTEAGLSAESRKAGHGTNTPASAVYPRWSSAMRPHGTRPLRSLSVPHLAMPPGNHALVCWLRQSKFGSICENPWEVILDAPRCTCIGPANLWYSLGVQTEPLLGVSKAYARCSPSASHLALLRHPCSGMLGRRCPLGRTFTSPMLCLCVSQVTYTGNQLKLF